MEPVGQPTTPAAGPATTPPSFMKPRVRRTWLRWLAAGLGVVVLFAAAFYLLGRPLIVRIARAELDRKLVDLSEALGRKVAVGGLSPTLTEAIVLERVSVPSVGAGPPVLILPEVRLDFSLWDALLGRRAPNRIVLDGMRVTVRVDGGRAPEIEELARGVAKYRAARKAAGTGKGGARLPEVEVRNATVVFVGPDGKEVLGAVRELEVEVRRGDAGAIEAEFTGSVAGLSEKPVRLQGVGTASREGGLYLNADLDGPAEVTRLLGGAAPVTASLTGVTVEVVPESRRASVGLRGLRVADSTRLLVREPLTRVASAGGPLSADEARVEVRIEGPGLSVESLAALKPADVTALTLRNADVRFIPSAGTWTEAAIFGLNADVTRDAGTGDLLARMDAGVDLGSGGASRVTGSARLTPELALRRFEGQLAGPILVQAISAFHPRLLPWPGARLDARLEVEGDGRAYTARGSIEGRGLDYFWTKLCLVPLTDVAFQADFEAEADLKKETLHIEVDPIQVNLARFSLGLDVQRFTATPKLKMRFTVPPQSCQAFSTAVPTVMVPRLEGTVLDGRMSFEIRLAIDLKNLNSATLEVDPDLEDCKAVTLGPLVDVEVLANRFTHRVVEEDLDEPILTGPATRDYVPIEEIPEVVQQAALATEDMNFFKHHGFAKGLIKRAITLNLDKGWYVYGGSTISQQLVKNLFLSREKTLARKLEEAVIVWQMESTLEKERILELYLNIVEFGKHIYGIKAAASAYFDKEPKELTALEAAWIMATKPSPRYAYNIYKKRQFNEWWVQRMEGILRRLWQEMDVIDESAYLDAAPYLPVFWYGDDGTFARPTVLSSSAVPPGMPAELPKEAKPVPMPENGDGATAVPAPAPEARPEPQAQPEKSPAPEPVRERPSEEPARQPAPAPAPAPATTPLPPPPPTL
jgi:hypothetical protein